jgi:hypothetical protein
MQSNSRIKRYLIKNIRGENVFLVKEYTNYSVKNFCGKVNKSISNSSMRSKEKFYFVEDFFDASDGTAVTTDWKH